MPTSKQKLITISTKTDQILDNMEVLYRRKRNASVMLAIDKYLSDPEKLAGVFKKVIDKSLSRPNI